MPGPRKRYPRDSLGFERLAFFSDAVYAIALTLIVVGIGLPELADRDDAGQMARALGDRAAEFVSYVIAVGVVGFYWSAHHEAYDHLTAVDRRYRAYTIVYLGLVAFLPYPIRLVGAYDANPLSIIVLALTLAAVSAMEGALLTRAWNGDLLDPRPSPAGFRWMRTMSLSPVPVFLLSIPLAFVQPFLTVAAWGLTAIPQGLNARRRPADLVGYD